MKTPAIDFIQIFCSNFVCDLDLKFPPSKEKSRRIPSVKWPEVKNFGDEILLRNSRYAIETLQLVLSGQDRVEHLENAVLEFYATAPIDLYWSSTAVLDALVFTKLVEKPVDVASILDGMDKKVSEWLNLAINKIKVSK